MPLTTSAWALFEEPGDLISLEARDGALAVGAEKHRPEIRTDYPADLRCDNLLSSKRRKYPGTVFRCDC